MAGRPKSVTENRVFDVSRPGKGKPVGTSRPVIVNQRKTVKDETIVEKEDSVKPILSPTVNTRTIKPLSEKTAKAEESAPEVKEESSIQILPEEKPEDEEKIIVKTKPAVKVETEQEPVKPEEEPASELEPAEEQPEAETSPTEETETEEEEPTEAEAAEEAPPAAEEKAEAAEETPAGSDEASVDALAEATEKKKVDAKEAEEQTKRDEALQQLIDSKQYVVPIGIDSSKKGHKGLWFLLILLLLAAGAYLAVDAKLVDVNIELPYHFFEQ